jgi:Predicted dehydrogenases and related proteins
MSQRGAEDVKKVAIIGCGFFAPNHIHAWSSLEGAGLVAVCDLNPQLAQRAAALAGDIPWYTDAAQLLEQCHPDVVDIITTAPSHLALARLCAERGVPAIIQKPLSFNFKEAIEIAALASRFNVPMMVHENFRFQAPMREIKSIIDSRSIGTLHYCRVAFRSGYDIFKGQPYLRESERLVLMDNGVHVFDVARFLMGEIAGLSCRTQRVRSDVRGEDMASALVKFSSGAMGVVEVSWGSFLPEDPFPETLIAVEGSAGSVVLDRHYRLSVRSGESVRTYSVEPECPAWGERPWHVVQDSVVEACRHWLDVAAGRAELQTSVQDNINTLAAVEACYISAAQNGAFVALSEPFRVTAQAQV